MYFFKNSRVKPKHSDPFQKAAYTGFKIVLCREHITTNTLCKARKRCKEEEFLLTYSFT